MNFKFVYKICTKIEWLEAKANGEFKGSKKDVKDGYIHFSDKEQLKDTLKKYYLNQKDLILLKVDALKLNSLIYEQASDGNMFPHLYSSLNIANVIDEFDITLNQEDGSHTLPEKY